jgi:membrane-associated protease RseP (regulator of RpoE activity)
MIKYTRVKGLRIYGAPVYLHWSALLVMGVLLGISFNSPVLAIISICSYFGIIMLHETGHAFVAHKLRCDVKGVYLGFLHGKCKCKVPENQKYKSLIAWGGVAAQLVVALPLIIGAQTLSINEIYGIGPVVAFMGYISVLVALVNIVPGPGLDGIEAWMLIPVLVKEYKTSRKNKGKSTIKNKDYKRH